MARGHSLGRRVFAMTLAAIACTSPGPTHLSAAATSNEGALIAMRHFLARPLTPHQYSALRRLQASGGGKRAWLDAQTDFSLASGLLYRVTAEGGSGYIRNRVLRSLLEEEQRLIAGGRTSRVAISVENYQFTPEGVNEEGFATIRMRPLRKDRSLIDGRMVLTADGHLLRVEGLLAKNPSFWVTRVNVVRTYREINGLRMPVSLETTAQLRLFGSSALRMSYEYLNVDGRAVEDAGTDR